MPHNSEALTLLSHFCRSCCCVLGHAGFILISVSLIMIMIELSWAPAVKGAAASMLCLLGGLTLERWAADSVQRHRFLPWCCPRLFMFSYVHQERLAVLPDPAYISWIV